MNRKHKCTHSDLIVTQPTRKNLIDKSWSKHFKNNIVVNKTEIESLVPMLKKLNITNVNSKSSNIKTNSIIDVETESIELNRSKPTNSPELTKETESIELNRSKPTNSTKTIDETKSTKSIESTKLIKYYAQRYLIFSRYNQGIWMDTECWYSVTPELIAKDVAKWIKLRLSNTTINRNIKLLDLFGGGGGDDIQCALVGIDVTTIDIDPIKLKIIQHNANIYNVKVNTILGDSYNTDSEIFNQKYDVMLASPPWGGIEYQNQTLTKISEFSPKFYNSWKYFIENISPNTVVYLPKNVNVNEIKCLNVPYEVVTYYYNGRSKMICVYTGQLICFDSRIVESN